MSTIEVMKRNNKAYYYVSKNFRIGKNKWKKIRRYVGPQKPTKKEIKGTLIKIENEAKSKGMLRKSSYSYLSNEDAEKLEDISTSFRKWYRKLSPDVKEHYQTDFLIRYTYNTNAIEGNRLSLRETSMIFTEDVIPTGASKNDFNEVLNSKDAMEIIKDHKGGFNRTFLLKIHKEITKNTKCRIVGAYRDSGVRIYGSNWEPPKVSDVPLMMKRLFEWYNNHRKTHHPVELAAMIHLRIAQIHPFTDGNGRTARVIMNWILLKHNYPMFYIEGKEKDGYYNAIEAGDNKDIEEYVRFIANAIINRFSFVSR